MLKNFSLMSRRLACKPSPFSFTYITFIPYISVMNQNSLRGEQMRLNFDTNVVGKNKTIVIIESSYLLIIPLTLVDYLHCKHIWRIFSCYSQRNYGDFGRFRSKKLAFCQWNFAAKIIMYLKLKFTVLEKYILFAILLMIYL